MPDLLINSAEHRCLCILRPQFLDASRKAWLAGWPTKPARRMARGACDFEDAPRVVLIELLIDHLTWKMAVDFHLAVFIAGLCPTSKTFVSEDASAAWNTWARVREHIERGREPYGVRRSGAPLQIFEEYVFSEHLRNRESTPCLICGRVELYGTTFENERVEDTLP